MIYFIGFLIAFSLCQIIIWALIPNLLIERDETLQEFYADLVDDAGALGAMCGVSAASLVVSALSWFLVIILTIISVSIYIGFKLQSAPMLKKFKEIIENV